MPPPLGIGSPSPAMRSLYLEPDEQLASARQPSAAARLRTLPAPVTRVTPRPIHSPRRNPTANRPAQACRRLRIGRVRYPQPSRPYAYGCWMGAGMGLVCVARAGESSEMAHARALLLG